MIAVDLQSIAGASIVAGAAILLIRQIKKEFSNLRRGCSGCDVACPVKDRFSGRLKKKRAAP